MGALSGFLSPLITASTQAATGYEQGQQKARDRETAQMVQAIQMKRQTEKDALAQSLGAANLAHIGAETSKLSEPKKTYDAARGVMVDEDKGSFTPIAGLPDKPPPPREASMIPGTPEWTAAEVAKAKIGRDYGYHAPEAPIIQSAIGADGQPHVFRIPKQGGDAQEVGGITPRPTGGGKATTATQQQQQARLLAAMSEARLADERMRAYEDKLLDGTKEIGPMKQAGGNLMMNLSGSHSALGAGLQAASEAGVNATDGEYAQYLRDAATIGRAEQMISPRGGNETMVRANSLLARAGTGAPRGTIEASRMARQALFGPSGGISQTMSPAQTAGMEAGVARIKSGEHGATSRPPLAERIQQLKASGVSKDAAKAQLAQEGYDLAGGH